MLLYIFGMQYKMRKSNFTSTYKLLLKRLISARKQAGLTQIQVAKQIRRPQSFVSKLESGERRLDVIEIAELASLYKVSLPWLLADIEQKYTPQSAKSAVKK